MTGPGACTLTVTPEEVRVCPGETVELAVIMEADSAGEVQIAAGPRDPGVQPRSVRTRVTSRDRRRVAATVEVAAAGAGDDYLIEVSCATGGELVASSVATVRVRNDVHLVATSLALDVGSMTGKVAIENCTGLTPEVGLRLACREGRIVFDVSVRAQLTAFGRDVREFHVADRSIDLGSCRLELVDGEENVLDRIPLENLPGLAPPPERPPSRLPLGRFLLGLSLLVVVGILWWLKPGPDSPGFSLGVEGSGTVQVVVVGERSFEVDRTTTFALADHDVLIQLVAEPSAGWEFTRWSDGRTDPGISVSTDDSGIVAEFIEAGPARLPDLTLQLSEGGPGIDVTLGSAANGCVVGFVVRNQGGDAGAPFVVLVVVRAEEADFGAQEVVGPMAAGEARQVRVLVPGAEGCQFDRDSDGSVTVDSRDDLLESDEANNTGRWSIQG